MNAIGYRLRGARVEYGTRRVIDIDSLELPAGGVTAVVGPNGAGKSTLLRLLAFLVAPVAGSIEFLGQPVDVRGTDLTRLRRQVTYVAQAPLLFRGSVWSNVAYGLRVRGAALNGQVDAALETVGLAGFGDRSAHRLSGGEIQRVAIARAIAIDPPALLFDEPTANLDRAAVPRIEALLRQLGAAGKTVVITSHNLEQAHRVSDRVVAVAGGRLVSSTDLCIL